MLYAHFRKRIFYFSGIIFILFGISTVLASDLSDANALRKKCEYQSKQLEIVVMNFGDQAEKSEFANGMRMLKVAKIKMAQTDYIAAKKQYNDYLKLEFDLYAGLARKYIDRTQKIIDEITVDLVDHIDTRKVNDYFKLASQNLKTAKTTMTRKHYKLVIEDCRRSKTYILACYKVVGKPLPDKYKVDNADNAKQLAK